MTTMQILTGPVAQAIGWALLHLLWQAAIVAGILGAVLALIPRQSANARYAAACSALGLVFLSFVATAYRAYDPAVAPVSSAPVDKATIKLSLTEVPVLVAAIAAETWRDRLVAMVATARQALPSIVGIWLAGVLFLSSRLMVAWMRTRRLTRRDSVEASADWQRVAARLSDALGLRRAVRLLESAAVEVPSVIGSLRPVILLPASTLTGMTPQQIEMVLAHELAHIRRHDFLVNLLQAVVETLMFYHPAVWWMSRKVREERENCCDDLAVAVCGNPIQYARALTRLEELRSAPSLLVAANGGSLLDRIRRIAGGRAESNAISARWAAALVTLTILIASVTIPSLPVFAQREPEPPAPPAPVVAHVDVVAPAAAPLPAPAAPPVPGEEDDEDETDADYDVDMDMDLDIDLDIDHEAPLAPAIAMAVDAAMPPMPGVAPAPMPAIAMTPRSPVIAPRPMALAGMAAYDFDDDDDDEDGDEERVREKIREKDRRGSSRRIGSGPLTVDELISLKAVGVTPEYIDQMRGLFPELTVSEVSNLKALGVSAAYVQDIRTAGLDVTSPRAISNLKAVGVNAKYVADMRAAGITIDSASTASNLKAVGVTPEYVREMRASGVKLNTAREASNMKAVGVTVKFVKQLAAAGYNDLSPSELSRMAAVGVDEEFIRDMQKYRDKK